MIQLETSVPTSRVQTEPVENDLAHREEDVDELGVDRSLFVKERGPKESGAIARARALRGSEGTTPRSQAEIEIPQLSMGS